MGVESYDVLVVGGGMAGVSIGFELAADRSVLVADMERTLAFHTTGRSAAMLQQCYGSPTVRMLTAASRSYLEDPPWEQQLLSPMPMLYIGRAGRGDVVAELYREVQPLVPEVALLDAAEAVALQPLLRPGSVDLALVEPNAMTIDVHALHQGYVQGLRARGSATIVDAQVCSASRDVEGWTVQLTGGRTVRAELVVNAAGAWADRLAERCAVPAVGLRPCAAASSWSTHRLARPRR